GERGGDVGAGGVEVGRQRAARSPLRAAGAAADRPPPRLDADAARRLVRGVGDARVAVKELLHVAVLLLDGHGDARAWLLRGELVRKPAGPLLVRPPLWRIEIARDEAA